MVPSFIHTFALHMHWLISNLSADRNPAMKVPYPLPNRKPYTGERVKELFRASGTAISAWAEANNYTRHQVYMVINGQF
ncbi:hypothetical protein, partial [Pseudomonas aeruginosa]|uniref:hypothetical protein n=1 Tax=Pseudomonas aeruginosa TaxID=287 RepID=UPI003264C562